MSDALTFRPGEALAPCVAATDLLTVRWDLTITALSPLCHSQGTMGNESIFNTEKVADPDHPEALPEDVPLLSGNSLRHQLREALAWLTMKEIGLELGSLPLPALHFLLAGGALGKQAATLDADSYRATRDLFPYLALLGGGIGTSLIEGKLIVGHAVLACRQNAWKIAEMCPALAKEVDRYHPAEEYRGREQGTRHDARRSPLADHLLPPADRDAWARERLKTAKAHDDEGSDSTQMIFGREVLISGSRLYWYVGGRYLTPLEHSGLICALLALQQRGYLGAAIGTGHGRVKLQVIGGDGQAQALADGLRFVEQGSALSEIARQSWGAPYVEHVHRNAEAIRAWLGGIK